MSKMGILAELPKLSPGEQTEILEKLWSMEEDAGPTSGKMALLNGAQAASDANPSAGSPWPEVKACLYPQP